MFTLNHIPLLRLLIPFIGGIITVAYTKPNNLFLLITFGFFAILFIVLYLIKKVNSNFKLRWLFGILIYINLFLAGVCLTNLKYKDANTISKLLLHQSNQLLVGKVTKPVQIKEKSIKVVLSVSNIKNDNKWIEGKGKVILYLQTDHLAKDLNIGDIIAFKSKLKEVTPPQNPNEFNFKKYLSFHLIHQQAYLKTHEWKKVKGASSNNIFKLANDSRKFLIKKLQQQGIQGKELAVASALIFGYKDYIDVDLKRAYASAGAMHVLAVSGLHVGIIFLIFNHLFSFFKKVKYGNIIKGILLITILWLYALLTGLSPSVMRAATMFSFIVASKMTNRKSSFFNTLAASALVLLIYNPLLIMEVGFQLSYMAVIGIVIIQPWVNNFFDLKFWLPKKIWEITAVSIAAQIATFPLSLLYFHQFPNYFMLSNLIVIPLAVLIMYLGIATLSLSFIPIIGSALAFILKYTIFFLNKSVGFIDTIPYSLTENIRFSILDAWLSYLFICSIILLIAYRKFKFLMLSGVFLIVFLSTTLLKNYTDLDQKKIVIYNIPKHSAINFISGNSNVFITNLNLAQNRKKLLFHVQNNWINNGLDKESIIIIDSLSDTNNKPEVHLLIKNNYIQFYNTTIAIINNKYQLQQNSTKIAIDLLIITENTSLSIAEIISQFNPKQIIIDASNSSYTSKRLKIEANELDVKCWSVLLDGAYQRNL